MKILKKIVILLLVFCFLFVSACATGGTDFAKEVENTDIEVLLSVEEALTKVRAVTCPNNTYIPINGIQGEIYSVTYINEDQCSYIVLYLNQTINNDYFFFSLSSFLSDIDTVRESIYNQYAVSRIDGAVIQKYENNADFSKVNSDYPTE